MLSLLFRSKFSEMSRQGKLAPQDSLDHFTYRWSVVLLLLLALVTWLLPFSPVFKTVLSPSSSHEQPEPEPPTYTATCWSPAQFERHQNIFQDKACTSAMNSLLRGEISEDLATIKKVTFAGMEDYVPEKLPINEPLVNSEYFKSISISLFIKMTLPLTLFIFALGLKLPQVIWIWLSGFGSINVNKTLESLDTGVTLDADSRSKLHSDIAQVTRKQTNNTHCLAVGYLVFKFLVCVVIAAEMLVIIRVTQPALIEMQTQNNELEVVKTIGNDTSLVGNQEQSLMLHCFFKIRQMTNVHDYMVQCLFEKENNDNKDNEASTENSSDLFEVQDLLWCYQALLSAVLTHLVVLEVVNVISLVTWVFQLMTGHSESRDMRFIILMSKDNSDPLVTQCLEENLELTSKPENNDDNI